jgi:hypothetical protein
MRTYGTVQASFWAWASERDLSQNAQMMALYLLTSPHTTGVGCFRLPIGYIAVDLRTVAETVRVTLSELIAIGFLEYDEASHWVWLTGYLDDNPIANPNVAKSFMPVIAAVPRKLPFYGRFLDSLDPSSNRFPNGFLNRLRNGMPNQEQEQEQQQDQTQEQDIPEADASAGKRFDPAGDDPKPVLFGPDVRAFVCRHTGKRPAAVGRLIGKWCREFGQDHAALLAALGEAQGDPPGNLIEWIGGVVRQRSNPTDALPRTVEEFRAMCDNDPAWRGVQ